MTLHCEPEVDCQHTAIEAVCDLFRGQEVCRAEFTVTRSRGLLLLRAHRVVLLDVEAGDPPPVAHEERAPVRSGETRKTAPRKALPCMRSCWSGRSVALRAIWKPASV